MAKRLGDILIEMNFIEPEQLQMALVETKKTSSMLGEVLRRLDWVNEEQLQMAIAVQSGAKILDTTDLHVSKDVIDAVPHSFARAHGFLPYYRDAQTIKVATANPFDVIAQDRLARLTGLRVETYLANRSWVEKSIDLHYHTFFSIDEDIEDITYGKTSRQGEEERRIVELAGLLIDKGQMLGASDIHIVPDTKLVRIYYRLDGVLQQNYLLPIHFHQGLVTRFKVMAEIDISNQNIPHDGRIKHLGNFGRCDLRMSTFPTHLGETIVLRLLAYNKVIGDLTRLGFEADDLARFMTCIKRPHGLILTTGPTGSGKTTTLFSALMTVNSPDINVMTIEDPIEYVVPTVRQTAINPKAGFDFAKALRAAMRQDPDVILVGEIRDEDTASLAVRASITGHLVLSTLHTNDAASAVSRLTDMGISTSQLSASLAMVVAQRLLRRVCSDCTQPHALSEDDRQLFISQGLNPPATIPGPVGCPQCGNSGYRGRAGIYELMVINRKLERLIANGAPRSAIEDAAIEGGCQPLGIQALKKAAQGVTSMEEVRRVVGDARI